MTDSPHLDRPLHPDVAHALLRALNGDPYAEMADVPHLDWTTAEGITPAELVRVIRDLATLHTAAVQRSERHRLDAEMLRRQVARQAASA